MLSAHHDGNTKRFALAVRKRPWGKRQRVKKVYGSALGVRVRLWFAGVRPKLRLELWN